MKYTYKLIFLFLCNLQFSCSQEKSEVQFALSKNLITIVQDYSNKISDDKSISVILKELKYDTSSYFIYSVNKMPSSNSTFCFIGETKLNERVIYLGITNTNFDSDFGLRDEDISECPSPVSNFMVHCTIVGDSILSISSYP